MPWKRYLEAAEINGTMGYDANGDPTMPRTRMLTAWIVRRFWNRVEVFRVDGPDAANGYRVGFVPKSGWAKFKIQKIDNQNDNGLEHKMFFGMRVGREDCRFFAVNSKGEQIQLAHLQTLTLSQARKQNLHVH